MEQLPILPNYPNCDRGATVTQIGMRIFRCKTMLSPKTLGKFICAGTNSTTQQRTILKTIFLMGIISYSFSKRAAQPPPVAK